MPTTRKEKIVEEMTDKFGRASSIFLVDFTGMDVNSTNELRRNFRESNVEYRVLKNTMARLSFQKAGIDGMDNFLKGVNAYAISYDDPTVPAKILEKNKEFKEKLILKAALFEGKIVGAEQVQIISKLPSKMELLSQLVSMLNSPMSKLVGTLNAGMSNLIYALKSLEEKKK
jgi:large subunit ribosomal protein L10